MTFAKTCMRMRNLAIELRMAHINSKISSNTEYASTVCEKYLILLVKTAKYVNSLMLRLPPCIRPVQYRLIIILMEAHRALPAWSTAGFTASTSALANLNLKQGCAR